MKQLFFILCALCLQISLFGQSANGTTSTSELPAAFLISEDDNAYGDLVKATPTLLLQICEDSMDIAYKKWIYMLADMEDSAVDKGFEIRGLKVWMNVFWNADGSIEHIVYYPKPNSKNIEYSDFTNFLNEFAESYKMDIKAEAQFAHYGSASFPTFVDQMFPERKNK